jgi:hypothetical protein
VDQYNIPLYNLQVSLDVNGIPTSNPQATISYYPVYQGFMSPAYINGVQVAFHTQKSSFFNQFPNVTQNLVQIGTGDGSQGPYTLKIPLLGASSGPINPPVNALLRGHVDISGIIANSVGDVVDPPLSQTITLEERMSLKIPVTSVFPAVYFTAIGSDGANVIACDSGQFLQQNQNYGLMMQPGSAPLGNIPLGDLILGPNVYSSVLNTINYITGEANIRFNTSIPDGADINAQCLFFQSGLPRSILFYNNVLTLRSPPDRQYLVELDAYLTPAAYLTTSAAIQFGYMSEYIARGAARKILSDTGDVEQLQFYEPLFREQEMLVWKRSQRQFTSTRTQTIYSNGPYNGSGGQFGTGQTSF